MTDRNLGREGRALVLEGVETWCEQWGDEYAEGIVTGYVLIAEVTKPGMHPFVLWVSGSGLQAMPSDDGLLAMHRTEGMMRAALREMIGASK